MVGFWGKDYFRDSQTKSLPTGSLYFYRSRVRSVFVGDWCHCLSFDPAHWGATDDLPSWFLELCGALSGSQAKGARSLAILTIWTLWGERNRRIFYGHLKPASKLFDDVKEAAMMWMSAGAKHLAALVDQRFSE
ncbi:hypothetical protein PVAP13_3NG304500 [Panicum virgatum]|uniref:Uncharacterized protein n=1 Tax=Panicum virgatum TaxID=38727 RepID=A0A8T0UHA5_PANVG|nr:hypothetical protein PVAP13_3NG304500 [Panicum virgatum]